MVVVVAVSMRSGSVVVWAADVLVVLGLAAAGGRAEAAMGFVERAGSLELTAPENIKVERWWCWQSLSVSRGFCRGCPLSH